MSSLLFPEIRDRSTLTPRLSSSIYLPIGIEGEAASGGTATVGTLYSVAREDESNGLFGAASELGRLIAAILRSGAGPVVAVASAKGASPTLVQRQAQWEKFESDENVRLRLTDSLVQAELVALADSAENADLIYNKQIAIGGMAAATAKATLITAAGAILSKRGVLIAPGVYDAGGTLRSGSYAAACVAAEIAKNPDPSNDLDLWTLPYLTGIEKGADGLSVFRRKVVAGTPVNDYEDLLGGGVSPLMPADSVSGGVMTTHLRTTFTTDATFDSISTRIIVDQVFLDVKRYLYDSGFLRLGNTPEARLRIQSGVEALLAERRSWITPVDQGDGTLGYKVSVTASANLRTITVAYEGTVVRGTSQIDVAANLTIPV